LDKDADKLGDDEGDDAFSGNDALDLARENLQALIIATVAYLDRAGLSVDDWIEGTGAIFAKNWTPSLFTSTDHVWDGLLLTYQSLGAEVLEAARDDKPPTMTLSGFPDPYICELFDVSVEVVARYNNSLRRIAGEIGYHLSWRYEGGLTHLTLTSHDVG